MKQMHFLEPKAGALPRVGRYELLAELASGGMASVYLARLVGIGGFQRLFAIKRMHQHLAHETEFVNMFLDEARLVAGIRHPNVVPVLEVGVDDGYYLVMEYVEGDMLASLLADTIKHGKTIPEPVVISMILDTLAGLHVAHEHVGADGKPVNIVHRDVSPQNILVDLNGTTKITDFGIAHATTRLSSTRGGQLKGKVAYMAPEQARGDPNIDRRADIFAAGIVAWESLASKRLFLAENEVATLSRLVSQPIPNLHEVNPNVAKTVAEVIDKALQRDPDKRYQTADEMARHLRDAARASGLLGTPSDVAEFLVSAEGDRLKERRQKVRQFLSSIPAAATEDDFTSVPSALIKAPQPAGMVPTPVGETTRPDINVEGVGESGPTPGSFVPSPDTAALLLQAQQRSRKTLLIAVFGAILAAMFAAFVIVYALRTHSSTEHVASTQPTGSLVVTAGPDVVPSQTPTTPSVSPDDSSSAAPPATSTTRKRVSPVKAWNKSHGRRPGKSGTNSNGVGGEPPSIDNVEKNPYR